MSYYFNEESDEEESSYVPPNQVTGGFKLHAPSSQKVKTSQSNIIAADSSTSASISDIEQHHFENLKRVQHACVKLNNDIEKYSIHMTKVYLPNLKDKSLQPTDKVNDIEQSISQIKTDTQQLTSQLSHFKTLNTYTPDQETRHNQACQSLSS